MRKDNLRMPNNRPVNYTGPNLKTKFNLYLLNHVFCLGSMIFEIITEVFSRREHRSDKANSGHRPSHECYAVKLVLAPFELRSSNYV